MANDNEKAVIARRKQLARLRVCRDGCTYILRYDGLSCEEEDIATEDSLNELTDFLNACLEVVDSVRRGETPLVELERVPIVMETYKFVQREVTYDGKR